MRILVVLMFSPVFGIFHIFYFSHSLGCVIKIYDIYLRFGKEWNDFGNYKAMGFSPKLLIGRNIHKNCLESFIHALNIS